MFCVLGVVLQTILDVYNCFTCIVSLYRNDPTPRKIDRWLVFQTLYIYIYIYTRKYSYWKNTIYVILKNNSIYCSVSTNILWYPVCIQQCTGKLFDSVIFLFHLINLILLMKCHCINWICDSLILTSGEQYGNYICDKNKFTHNYTWCIVVNVVWLIRGVTLRRVWRYQVVIRICKSKKDRQHNGQKKKYKQRSTKHTH